MDRGHRRVLWVAELGDTKVGQVHAVVIQKNVCGFDVSVGNVVLVHVPQAIDELPQIPHRRLLWDRHVQKSLGLLLWVCLVLQNSPATDIVHHHVHLLRLGVVNNGVERHNVLVPELLHDRNLSPDLRLTRRALSQSRGAALLRQRFVDNFDSDELRLVVAGVGELHLPIGALPQIPQDNKIVDDCVARLAVALALEFCVLNEVPNRRLVERSRAHEVVNVHRICDDEPSRGPRVRDAAVVRRSCAFGAVVVIVRIMIVFVIMMIVPIVVLIVVGVVSCGSHRPHLRQPRLLLLERRGRFRGAAGAGLCAFVLKIGEVIVNKRVKVYSGHMLWGGATIDIRVRRAAVRMRR